MHSQCLTSNQNFAISRNANQTRRSEKLYYDPMSDTNLVNADHVMKTTKNDHFKLTLKTISEDQTEQENTPLDNEYDTAVRKVCRFYCHAEPNCMGYAFYRNDKKHICAMYKFIITSKIEI